MTPLLARRRVLPSLLTGLLAALPLAVPASAASPPGPRPGVLEGVLTSVAVHPPGGAEAVVQHVRVGDRLLPVHGQLPTRRSGARVLVPADGPVRADEVELLEAAPATTTTGTRSVLVVPVYATARDGQTRTSLHAEVQGTAGDYYREVSYGALELAATTLDWQSVAAPLPCSDFYAMQAVAAGAARSAGHDPDAFDSVVIYGSAVDCAGQPAEAEVGGRYSLLRGDVTDLVHELGHNLGLGHANALYCTGPRSRPVALSDTCRQEEYGDPYDAMGTQRYHFDAPHKASLGWLDGRTRTLRSTGTTWLRPFERAGRGPVALRVEAGYRTYWLEARRPVGVDRSLPWQVTNGALVHLDDGGSTRLLDMTPRTPFERDQDLGAGRSWTDPERGVRISVGARTGRSLPVTVTYLPGFSPPVQALAATAAPDVQITWTGWPGRTPDAVAVRRNLPGEGCPTTRHEGTAVGGTAWRTSQADEVVEGEYTCYSVFARYGLRWSPAAQVNPGCSTAAARPGEVTAFC